MQYKCQKCEDTGSISKHLSGSPDCASCDVATERLAMENFLDKLPAMSDYDAAWLVHQRALAMAPKLEAPAQEPVAWLVYAEDHNGMAPQHPSYATKLHAVRCAGMFWETPTEVRPLYDHAAPAAANGAMPELPKPETLIVESDLGHRAYSADQMRAYGQACAAAGPDAALFKALKKLATPGKYGTATENVARAALSGAKGN